jgi:hypothetical protein
MSASEGTAIDGSGLFRRVSFVVNVTSRVRSLSGWKKTHSTPEPGTDRAQEYVATISADELKHDLDTVYSSLKDAFGFKRRELSVAEPADGTGTIITPFFSYSISVSLNAADPAEVIWTKTVDSITHPSQIASAAFAEVFDGMFRSLQFSLPEPVNVADTIDAIEDAEIPNLELSYDRDATHCELRFTEAAGTIRITADTLAIVEKQPAKISSLVESLSALQRLVHKHKLPMDWGGGK